MPLHDLDSGASRLWPLIREQVAETAAAGQDDLRLQGVLARRRARSQQFFAAAAGDWDRLRSDLFGDTFYLWAVLGLIDPTLVVGDLGCGTGQFTETIAPYVRRVIAVDGSTDMLDAVRRRVGERPDVDIRQGDLEALPLEAGELDCAMLALVLHHAPNPANAIVEVARVVKPGGRLLVVDMLPHEREEYQQQMGHVWLGFAETKMSPASDRSWIRRCPHTRAADGSGMPEVRDCSRPWRREGHTFRRKGGRTSPSRETGYWTRLEREKEIDDGNSSD